jgi:hypothetical protein
MALRELTGRVVRARRARLYLPAVLAPVAETAVLWFLGPKGSAALGPQVTAPPPFDVFHDLRWISVYHNSWPLLALELVGIVVFRGLYVAWMIQGAWPRDDPPAMPRSAVRAAAFYAAASLLLLPWVALLFGLALTHLSYLFFVALPPAIAIVLLTHRGALAQGAGRWWRWRPTWQSLAWAAGAFLWLTAAGAVISVAPLPVALLAAAAAGFANARAVEWIAASIGREWDLPPKRHQALVPIALATTFAVVIGGTTIGFAADVPSPGPTPGSVSIPARATGHPVLVAAGFNSQWNPAPVLRLPRGYVAWRYSYRGIGPGDTLLPYQPSDTLQPLLASARMMATQVQALSRTYGSPVTIVAESEGAIVARAYLVSLYRPVTRAVDRLVILDMPVGPTSVSYPPPGAQGWGVASGWALRGIAAIVERIGPLRVSADAPLFRDIASCSALMTRIVESPPPPGVEEVSVQALADAVDGSEGSGLPDAERFVVVSAHGGLIGNAEVQSLIYRTLAGGTVHASPGELSLVRFINAVSEPWHAPALLGDLTAPRSCAA